MGKNSKKASQVRKKGDNSKSKRTSKKLLGREDSYSESSDESQSLASSSSFSSEEDVKKRVSRSRARKDGRGDKKRVRSSSSRSKGSFDSRHAKMRKGLKRKVGGKKKIGKKSRRADNISLSSSDEDEHEHKKSKSRSKKKHGGRRYDELDKGKIERRRYRSPSPISSSSRNSVSEAGRKRKRYRYPSGSLSSRSSASESEKKRKRYWSPSPSLSRGSTVSDRQTQNKLELQNKPTRHLKSVIVVATELDQDSMREPDMDGKKNISAYNYNYYDSCSNRKEHEKDRNVRDDEKNTRSGIVETVDQITESTGRTTATNSVPEREDLEVILRLKALQNLKRIRRGPWIKEQSDKMGKIVTDVKLLPYMENAADQNDTGCTDMKQPLSSDIESIQTERGHARPDSNLSVVKKTTLPTASTMEKASSSVVASKTAMANTPTSAAEKLSSARLPTKTVLTATPTSTVEKTSSSQVPPKVASVLSKSSPEKSCDAKKDEVIPKNVSEKAGGATKSGASGSENPSSSPATVAAEQESNKGERNEDSQYQQKTMTVMRGGEMVEVSYKVYIPRKAPALARRKLKR